MEEITMPRPTFAVALAATFVLAGLLTGCSGAPKDDAPDYEVDFTAGGGSTGAGERNSRNSTDEEPLEGMPREPAPEQSTKSAEEGSGTGTGTGTGTTTPAPAPTKVSVKIDGQELTIVETKLWSGVSKPGEYDVFVKVTGNGVAAGSDIHVWASETKSGCVNTSNYLAYRPQGDTQYMPKSANEPTCGLTVTELPTAVGGRFKATFDATLYGINTTTPKTKRVTLTVDVLREK